MPATKAYIFSSSAICMLTHKQTYIHIAVLENIYAFGQIQPSLLYPTSSDCEVGTVQKQQLCSLATVR